MSQREPKRLPFSSLDEFIHSGFLIEGERPYICNDFGIIVGVNHYPVIKDLFIPSMPYRIDDVRFVVFSDGDMDVTANLRQYHVRGNTLGIMGNGGIIQIDRINKPVKMAALLIKEDYLRLALGGRLPTALNGIGHRNYLYINDEERSMIEYQINLLRALVGKEGYSRETAMSMIAAIGHYIAYLFKQYDMPSTGKASHPRRVFEQFIDLVNEHCTRYHMLDFYADRLCITQRYLGTLVRQASGATAKEWIDRAILNEAKVALKHSNDTVAQIADNLSFPNPAFFTKFFKRMSGMTPSQYRSE